MLGSFIIWAKGLSLVGKTVGMVSAAVVGGTIVSAAASSTGPQQDIEQPVQQTETAVTKELKSEESPIPFAETLEESPTLEKGQSSVKTEGVNGVRTTTYEITYTNSVETSRTVKSEEVTKQPVNKVTVVGTYVKPTPKPAAQKPTSSCDPNYTPCVPNVAYDLDCPDIGFSVTVIGVDKHGFDGNDNDGQGCESY